MIANLQLTEGHKFIFGSSVLRVREMRAFRSLFLKIIVRVSKITKATLLLQTVYLCRKFAV